MLKWVNPKLGRTLEDIWKAHRKRITLSKEECWTIAGGNPRCLYAAIEILVYFEVLIPLFRIG